VTLLGEKAAVLRREVGEGTVIDESPARFAIGGREPELVLAPATADEAARSIRAAAGVGLAIAPVGGGTALGGLVAPARPFVALTSHRVAGVVEHAADDLTITVRAGTTIAELASSLAGAGQRLPVDTPLAARATVGGVVAVAPAGPLRLGHGTLRDYLLGITVVDARGRTIRAGGRVVKNVAGYDLRKLYTGARGTLGMVVEATFRLVPEAAVFTWVAAAASPPVAEVVRRKLRVAQVPAVALELVSGGLATPEVRVDGSEPPFVLAVGIEGVAAEIAWQVERVGEVLAGCGAASPEVIDGDAARRFLGRIVDFGAAADVDDPLVIRGAVLPSCLPELVDLWCAVVPGAEIAAGSGSGTVRLVVADATAEAVAALRAGAARLGGHAVVEHMPAVLRGHADPWGLVASPLAARIKDALDPSSVFLPGSYMGLGGAPRSSATEVA
jgi:glycolate oxidase FAD binding subunit